MNILAIIFTLLCIAFFVFQVIGLVKDIKTRKNNKKQVNTEKQDDNNNKGVN